MNFLDFLNKFDSEEKIIEHFVTIRYGEKVKCNHCGSEKVYRRSNSKFYDCKECNNTFSIFKDTIFEKSDTDLRKWFYAIHLFLNGKKGISGLQLQREIKVTYKTAWRILQKIRLAMGNKENQMFFNTILEIDETYVGGKPRKSFFNDDDDLNPPTAIVKRGRGTKKTPVVGVIDRNNKMVYAKVMMPNKEGKKLTGNQLLDILKRTSIESEKTVVMSDEFTGYNILAKTKYIHLRINHQELYSKDGVNTNSVESFWATLKRGIYGIYHHVSVKYLQKYVDEFCFRYNNRKMNMFDMVLKQAILVN